MDSKLKGTIKTLTSTIPEDGVFSLVDLSKIEGVDVEISFYSLLKKYGMHIVNWDRKSSSFNLKEKYLPLTQAQRELLHNDLVECLSGVDYIKDMETTKQRNDRVNHENLKDTQSKRDQKVILKWIFTFALVPITFYFLKWTGIGKLIYDLINL